MQLNALFMSTTLAVALAPISVLAWAQGPGGVWVANNKWYPKVGNYNNVHESCTRMNSDTVLTSGDCAYWIDGNECKHQGNEVACVRGCPNSFSPCQYVQDNGECAYGYSACLQKVGCSGQAGGADCIGLATGCLACR